MSGSQFGARKKTKITGDARKIFFIKIQELRCDQRYCLEAISDDAFFEYYLSRKKQQLTIKIIQVKQKIRIN